MRKYIIIPLVLVCLASAGILWAYIDINSQQDDINIKETIEAGQPDAAKGIKVTTKIQDDMYNLNWTTDMFLDGSQEIKAETEFTYDSRRKIQLFQDIEDTYYLTECFSNRYISMTDAEWERGKEELFSTGFPTRMATDAYEAAGGKKDCAFNCYLDDYINYLPVELDLNSYHYGTNYLQTINDIKGNPLDLTCYFQFPVPEKFPYQVIVNKGGSAFDTDVSIDFEAVSDSSYYYDVKSDGIFDGDQLILAVSGIENTADGKILSSLPADKKGIHVIPAKTQHYTYLDLAKGKRVYPIDADEQVLCLRESEDGKTLFLLTKSSDGLALHVIDKETFQCRQKLDLNQKVNGKEFYLLQFAGEKGIFLLFNKGVFLFLDEEDGTYKEVLTNTIGHPEEAPYIDCDYDGERLAIALIDWESNVIETQLHVFDKDGSLYSGRFDYSHAQYCYDEDFGSGYEKRVFVEFTDEI